MFDATTIEVFVASTNDMMEEREAVEEVLRNWNSDHARERQIMLKAVRWELDMTPEMAGGFQEAIDKQLLQRADVLIGIIGHRLGSPTNKAIAGTVEEITTFADAKKPVLLYFSDRPVALSKIKPEELAQVAEFRRAMSQRGSYKTYDTIDGFKRQIQSHLTKELAEFKPFLIPAANALAFGYFNNFVKTVYDALNGRNRVEMVDPKLELKFNSFKIRIGVPKAWEAINDNTIKDLKASHLEIVSLQLPRRPFPVYVPKGFVEQLDKTSPACDLFQVVDFPTPLIALYDFVEQQAAQGERESTHGYWQTQREMQFEKFFSSLDGYVSGKGRSAHLAYFEYSGEVNAPLRFEDEIAPPGRKV